MKKNITLKIEESLLKKFRHAAVEEGKSVSQWVMDSLAQTIINKELLDKNRDNALKFLKTGFNLGGKPLSRDEIYDR